MSKTKMPKFDVHGMRLGIYSDKYFLRTRDILVYDNFKGIVQYQYFPRKDVIVCGINHVIDIFRKCTGYYTSSDLAYDVYSKIKNINPYNFEENEQKIYEDACLVLNKLWVNKFHEISISTVEEGSEINDMEPVIGVVGNPKYFAHLETPTLGVLAQQSAVATSVRRVINELKTGQDLMFFPARFRHYLSQAPDGYAAAIGGAKYLSTDSNGEYLGMDGVGTIPHLLIAAYGGDTALAAIKFDEYTNPSINRVILVDWDNDCIGTTLKVLQKFSETTKSDVVGEGKGKIFGVRFDTSGTLRDKSVTFASHKGVCAELVYRAREKFDNLGLRNLKIIVSGGFNIEKIKTFQDKKVPVDIFGIGSSIVNNFSCDFTADAVTLNGKPNAKVGRHLMDWSKLKIVY